jgi:CBS domain-containing protein
MGSLMTLSPPSLEQFLSAIHPYDAMDGATLRDLAAALEPRQIPAGGQIYKLNAPLEGLFIVFKGDVEIRDEHEVPVSLLGPRNSFGERGLLRDGDSLTSARAVSDTIVLVLPADRFHKTMNEEPTFRRFFDRSRAEKPNKANLATTRVEALMATAPLTCPPETDVQSAARLMRDARVSSICVADGDALKGIATIRDLSGKVVGDGLPFETPISKIMTPDPVTLPPSAIGSDVLHKMMERRIGHVPVTQGNRLVGIVTQTDLTRFQAVSSAELVSEIAHADSAEEMAKVTHRIPQLLAQLVAGGNRHEVITRLITDVADTATRRLLSLAEKELGAPPVAYLWLACGSQGRQEQTGVSDQDNCLFIDDAVTEADMPYFEALATFVCHGLNTCGYVYCPGDMMATNPRWRQPLRVWREYFAGWIKTPSPEAQMLASVMFDLRPIGGAMRLFEDLQAETLKKASSNSIFVAHMVSNSLKHTPPLGLLRGFATIRSGEHKNQIDLKHNGVVPVVDLGRIYALQGQLTPANTAARLEAAIAAGVVSKSGGQDLKDAYDLVAETRLEHQAAQVRAGIMPDNFLSPSDLSDFERSHLRDAFVVIKSMQSSVGHGRGMLS